MAAEWQAQVIGLPPLCIPPWRKMQSVYGVGKASRAVLDLPRATALLPVLIDEKLIDYTLNANKREDQSEHHE